MSGKRRSILVFLSKVAINVSDLEKKGFYYMYVLSFVDLNQFKILFAQEPFDTFAHSSNSTAFAT